MEKFLATGLKFIDAEVLNLFILPLKFLAVAVFATLSRIFYEKDEMGNKAPKVTVALVFTRIFMSLFVLITSFYILREFVDFSENTSLFISGGLAFAFREVIDNFLKVVKKPFKAKEILGKKGSYTDTVDPSGEEFPDEEG